MNEFAAQDSAPALDKVGKVKESAAAEQDLSREIERAVEREPSDSVRCVRVFGDFYRCNWWSRLASPAETNYDWSKSTGERVRKSRFVKVTKQLGQLVIADVRGEIR